jgi:hypothetical protein
MAHTAAIAAAIRNTPQPLAYYTDEPEFSPPPYPYSERQLLPPPPPPQFAHQVSNNAAEDPPEYNFYDVERGSLIDVALAQYAQSISPSAASTTRYMMLEAGEDDPERRLCADSTGRLKRALFYCMAVFCGITWAAFWVCVIGYAIVMSFQKVAERLS